MRVTATLEHRPDAVVPADGPRWSEVADRLYRALPSDRGISWLVTLAITLWASRHTKTAADFYAGGRSFSGIQNGVAIGGDYMSAASFLGIAGIIALFGYDGFLYSIGFLVAWLVALLLVAELMRNTGKYTMADVLDL